MTVLLCSPSVRIRNKFGFKISQEIYFLLNLSQGHCYFLASHVKPRFGNAVAAVDWLEEFSNLTLKRLNVLDV
jgi:hypothetical protein